MKVITTNLLNRFWENGIKPIKTALGGKLDVSKVIKSTNITENGFVMDGKTAADAFAQLNKNITTSLVLKNVDTTTCTSASVYLHRCGRIVMLDLYDICPETVPPGQDVVIAEGLPKNITFASTTMLCGPPGTAGGLRVGVDRKGRLSYWWVGSSIVLKRNYSGQLVYLTND